MAIAAENVPNILLWLPAVSTVLLLLSALAAWRTAAITARSFRRSVTPTLDVTFLLPRPGPLQLVVRNLGGGDAKTPFVMLVVGRAAMSTYIPGGLLEAGDGVKFTTDIDASEAKEGQYFAAMAGCRDIDNTFHAWTSHWEHRTFLDWLRRPVKTLDWGEAFEQFYPGIDPPDKDTEPLAVRIEPVD